MNPEPTWQIGLFVGLTIAALVIVGAVFAIVYFTRWLADHDHYNFDYGAVKWMRRGAIALIPITVVFTALTTFPWEAPYHRYEPKVGTVEAIEKRIVPSGDGIEEKFAVRFVGDDPTQYGCLDTRCSNVKPGDELALKCLKKWDYQGADGYDCRYVEARKKA